VDARRVLAYLRTTQEADGHWSQNMWLDGTPYWSGLQLDEAAFPILLVDLAQRKGALAEAELADYWPMARQAAAFVVQNGPVTAQDRWEEDPGYSPFTLAVEIAALLVAADLAERHDEPDIAAYLRETADVWNAGIERWTYVTGSELAQQVGVDGYYVRIAPPDEAEAASLTDGYVPIKNRPPGQNQAAAARIVSPDALALVRFGLRAADDPRIVNTVKVIDALLKIETPVGPTWRRYNEDGYGEHADGAPFDGTGMGRGWPLLTGERAHYELAAGRPTAVRQLLQTLAAFANDGQLLSEQVWDSPDLPEKELFLSQPSGSAMPLVWAHAEYIKLCRSLGEGQVFDLPPQTKQRYQTEQAASPYTVWRYNHKCRTLPAGQTLRLELSAPAQVHWSADNWQTTADQKTRDTGLGLHLADLPTTTLAAATTVNFTFYWLGDGSWSNVNYSVSVAS
jgi:glucoamylase